MSQLLNTCLGCSPSPGLFDAEIFEPMLEGQRHSLLQKLMMEIGLKMESPTKFRDPGGLHSDIPAA